MWVMVTPFWWHVFVVGLTASVIIGVIAGVISWIRNRG
jgi:hypothetical protein